MGLLKKPKNNNNGGKKGNRHVKFCNELSERNFSKETKKKPKHIIVVGDLHGDIDKWKSLRKYMSKNPNMHVVILGDAMDRGNYGISILLQIKELSDMGRVTYIPGNHDGFLYNYVITQEILKKSISVEDRKRTEKIYTNSGLELMANRGMKTKMDVDNFEETVERERKAGNIRNLISREDFFNWIGDLPLQLRLTVGSKKYAMAHACFNDELYHNNSKYNLSNLLCAKIKGPRFKQLEEKLNDIIWHRRDEKILSFPNDCDAMIVGHNPVKTPGGSKICYIDTSITPYLGMFDCNENKTTVLEPNGKIAELEDNQFEKGR